MSTAVAPAANRNLTIRDRLKSPALAAEIARVLPSHIKPERMLRVALTALTRTPKLADCTQESFFECLLSLSQWGLEPDGRRAHLIPYGNKCTLIIDYKGIAELVIRSGNVTAIHADVVRTGDAFEYSAGYVTKHTPHFLRVDADKPADAGKVYAAYCIVKMKNGAEKHEVMSAEDVEAIRKRSKAGSSGPWVTDWNEMAKKTVFRRCSKWLPWSAEIIDAMDRDDDTVIDVPSRATDTLQIGNSLESLTAEIEGEVSPPAAASSDEPPADYAPQNADPKDAIAAEFESAKTRAAADALKMVYIGPGYTPEIREHAEVCYELALKRFEREKKAKPGTQGDMLHK